MPSTVPQEQDSLKPRTMLAFAVISHPLKTRGFSNHYESGIKLEIKVSSINGLNPQETQILVETDMYPIRYNITSEMTYRNKVLK